MPGGARLVAPAMSLRGALASLGRSRQLLAAPRRASMLPLHLATVPQDRAVHHGASYHSSLQPRGYNPPRGPRRFGPSARFLTTTASPRTSRLARRLSTLSRDESSSSRGFGSSVLAAARIQSSASMLRRFEPEMAWRTHQRRDEARTCFLAVANPLRAIAVDMTAHVPAARRVPGGRTVWGRSGRRRSERQNSRRERSSDPQLRRAVQVFGADRPVLTVRPENV